MATGGQLTWAQLVAVARRVGVKVVEAPSSHRGQLGKMGSVVGVTEHTTGTANSFKPDVDYPDYNVVKEGRAGLENSLSAYGVGRFEAIYVFSEFLSWHAGVWNWRGVTDGNGHFLGIECAGVGDYTEFQRKVYPRLVAAILLEINQTPDWAPRHLDGAVPQGRKVDAQGFDDFYQGKSFRQWVEFFMANPAYININYGGNDVGTLEGEQAFQLRDANINAAEGRKYLGVLAAKLDGLTAAVGTLAEAVASGRDDLTAADLKAAVKEAIAEGVVKVDVSVQG